MMLFSPCCTKAFFILLISITHCKAFICLYLAFKPFSLCLPFWHFCLNLTPLTLYRGYVLYDIQALFPLHPLHLMFLTGFTLYVSSKFHCPATRWTSVRQTVSLDTVKLLSVFISGNVVSF